MCYIGCFPVYFSYVGISKLRVTAPPAALSTVSRLTGAIRRIRMFYSVPLVATGMVGSTTDRGLAPSVLPTSCLESGAAAPVISGTA